MEQIRVHIAEGIFEENAPLLLEQWKNNANRELVNRG
jgi:hypothetical protein